MAIPAAFQRYANEVVKGKFNEIKKYWDATLAKNPDLAVEMKKLPATGRLEGRVIDAMRRVHDSMRKGSGNSNNRGHRTTGAAKAPRPARAAQPAFTELRLLDMDAIVSDENGNSVSVFEAEMLSCDSAGITFASEKSAADAIILHLGDEQFNEPCAMVCKATLLERASSAQRKEIVRRFHPTDFLGVYADAAGKPYMIKSTMFQFGPPTIAVTEHDDVVEVTTESAQFTVLSVQIPNTDGDKDFENKAKASFQKVVTLAAGHKNLYGDKLPRWTRL